MDFFSSQESLTTIQWILRAIISFFFLLFITKIMGQRSISQLRLLDFIMALSIGNIIAHPLSDEHLGMKGSMITITVMVILYLMGIFLVLKWPKFRNFINAPAFPLIEDGKIVYKNLAKARISIDVLLSELRKEKIEEIDKVALAFWEADGTLSIFLDPQYQTVTPSDLQLAIKPFHFSQAIIKEGKILSKELHQTGKSESWLKNEIKNTYNLDIHDILLATIDDNDNVKICLYH
jgi:uncharacterized membrane protein YcaP (DUF421 family)